MTAVNSRACLPQAPPGAEGFLEPSPTANRDRAETVLQRPGVREAPSGEEPWVAGAPPPRRQRSLRPSRARVPLGGRGIWGSVYQAYGEKQNEMLRPPHKGRGLSHRCAQPQTDFPRGVTPPGARLTIT